MVVLAALTRLISDMMHPMFMAVMPNLQNGARSCQSMTFHFLICERHSICGEARGFPFISWENRSRPPKICGLYPAST
jgi:hypothetical protein